MAQGVKSNRCPTHRTLCILYARTSSTIEQHTKHLGTWRVPTWPCCWATVSPEDLRKTRQFATLMTSSNSEMALPTLLVKIPHLPEGRPGHPLQARSAATMGTLQLVSLPYSSHTTPTRVRGLVEATHLEKHAVYVSNTSNSLRGQLALSLKQTGANKCSLAG